MAVRPVSPHPTRDCFSVAGNGETLRQPLAPRVRLGRTECVNVGHFQRTAVPNVLQW